VETLKLVFLKNYAFSFSNFPLCTNLGNIFSTDEVKGLSDIQWHL